ncbi:hypothetical protein [Mesorhizobium shangrilense]|uniref:Uncharacterized protein n=1 Tax=Mesorhizobium shangrilense TaxID=460060 RepID=A0ABV2DC27_9HYPH
MALSSHTPTHRVDAVDTTAARGKAPSGMQIARHIAGGDKVKEK